jgi:hypothetical protein
LTNTLKPNDKILRYAFRLAGSITIACHDYGYELTACELDKEYYDKAIKRIKNHISQTKLFNHFKFKTMKKESRNQKINKAIKQFFKECRQMKR